MNTQQQSELEVFSSPATRRENGQEKSLGSNRFSSCLNVVFTIPSATSKPRTTVSCALRLTNYDVEF